MGTVHVSCAIEDVNRAGSETVLNMLVDAGSEHTWVPGTVLQSLGVKRQKKDLTFRMANGSTIPKRRICDRSTWTVLHNR